MLGNEHGSTDVPICEVSQNIGYQLYATMGAFFIPLAVMIFMYYKIYVAAKRVVDAEFRDQRPSCSSATSQCVSLLKSCSITTSEPAHHADTNHLPAQSNATLYPNLQYHQTHVSNYSNSKLYPGLECSGEGVSNHNISTSHPNHNVCSSPNCILNEKKTNNKKSSKSKKSKEFTEQRKVQRMLNVIKRDRKSAGSLSAATKSSPKSVCTCCCSCVSASSSSSKSSTHSLPITDQPTNNNNSLTVIPRTTVANGNGTSAASTKSALLKTTPPILTRHHGNSNNHKLNKSSSLHHQVQIQHHRIKKSLSSDRASLANVNYKRRASNALRERKASFTLGEFSIFFILIFFIYLK